MPAIKMAKLDDAMRILNSGEIRQGMEILEDLLRAEPENVNVLYNLSRGSVVTFDSAEKR
jgi:hypothetical protein